MLITAMKHAATFDFAISGATRGVHKRPELFAGGGAARDLLTRHVMTVLRSEPCAVATLADSATVALGAWLGLPYVPVTILIIWLFQFLRSMSANRGWRWPVAATHNGSLRRTD